MEGDSRAEVRRAAADAVVRFAWALGDGKALVRAARVFPETVRRVLGLAAQQKRPLSGAQKGLLLLLWKHPDLQHDDRLRFYIERLLKAPDKEREIHLSI